MFGAKPYNNPAAPTHNPDTSGAFQHLINGEKLDDIEKKVIAEKKFDTNQLTSEIEKTAEKTKPITKLRRFVLRKILPKVSKRINSINSLSDSLETLNELNKNIDKLITEKSAANETLKNYEELAQYLTRASQLESRIVKSMRIIK